MSVPACTCDFTWEEMDAAASPWHRYGCPQGRYERGEKRYHFHCVAPEVQGPGDTDDLDEALLFTCSYYGSHWDIWDSQEGKYVEGIHCQEDEDELRDRIAKAARGRAMVEAGHPPHYTRKERVALWSVRKILGLLERVDHLWPQ